MSARHDDALNFPVGSVPEAHRVGVYHATRTILMREGSYLKGPVTIGEGWTLRCGPSGVAADLEGDEAVS